MRCIAAVLLGWLACGADASAQVTVDATTNNGPITGSSTSFVHTAAGSNRGLLVIVHMTDSGSGYLVSTLTNNSMSLTLACAAQASDIRTEIWTASVAPVVGSNTILVGTTGTTDFVAIAMSFNGVDQGSFFGTAVCDQYNAGMNPSGDDNVTTSQTDGMVIDALTARPDMLTLAISGGQTSVVGVTAESNFQYVVSRKAGAASVTTGDTWTSEDYWAHVTIPVIPAAAGGGGGGHHRMMRGAGH